VTKPVDDLDPGDLLWGAEAIAAAIGRTPRQTFKLLETGKLPAKKIGRRWFSTKRALARAMALGEAA
jgi:hypothetical protein